MFRSYSEYAPNCINTLNLKKKSGKEYGNAPCPSCGGDDRFWITEHNGEFAHHCRQNCDFITRDKVLQDRGIFT